MPDPDDRKSPETAHRERLRLAVARAVATAPPLSERQRARLRAILGGLRRPPADTGRDDRKSAS